MKKIRRTRSKRIVTGKVDYNAKGYGFLVGAGPDVFIPRKLMNRAFMGDTVRAEIVDGEARVLEIIERGVKEITGVVYRTYGQGGIIKCSAFPDFLVRDASDAEDGDVVVARITDYSALIASIVTVLGKNDDVRVRAKAIQASFGVTDMPFAVEKAARELCVTEDSLKGRRDYRADTVITIDGEDSKDFDDGVSLIRVNGGYRLFVHIADVAEFVKKNDKIDKEAFQRGTSCYFAGLVVPMLPSKLSDDICSLRQGEDRLTLSVEIDINADCEITGTQIREGVICSRARMTYGQVNGILNGKVDFDKDVADMLSLMKELALRLKKKRRQNGEISFDIPEAEFEIKDGRVTDVRRRPRLVSHEIIEQFMITANEAVARFMTDIGSPFIYRVHTPPPQQKLEALNEFLEATGYGSLPEKPEPLDVSRLLSDAPQSVRGLVSKVTLRSMAKASYETKNEGHFGLASDCYCHFTSPIRRYPDLAIHRVIKDYLRNGEGALSGYAEFCVQAAKTGSEKERNAEALERKVDDMLKADYMKDKVGERFDGIISGVTEWGIFVELASTVEGMIRIEKLPGRYSFDAVRYRLSSPSRSYGIGDKISVVVAAVYEDKIEFLLNDQKDVASIEKRERKRK